MIKAFRIFVVGGLAALTACQSASSGQPGPIDAGTLIREYEQSKTGARRKYDGKEITVRGYAESAAALPDRGADQGFVKLKEKDIRTSDPVTCWFSSEQTNEFQRVKSDQHITVKGVFTGEAGAELKFCKLIAIE